MCQVAVLCKKFSFQVRGTDIKSDRQYYIGSYMKYLVRNPNTKTLGLPYNPQENQEILIR